MSGPEILNADPHSDSVGRSVPFSQTDPAVSSLECCGGNTLSNTVLSQVDCPILADMHDKFDRIRFENERETMRCFSSLANGRQLDLLEVCAPWDSPLASAVENHGGTVFRMGIHNGFDLGTRAGFLKAVYVLK